MRLLFFRKTDAYFLKTVRRIRSSIITKSLSRSGSFTFCFVMIIGVFFLPYPTAKTAAAASLCAVMLDTLMLFILKYSVRRTRPAKPAGLRYRCDPYSFPSGHASRIAAISVCCFSMPPVMCGLIILCLVCAFCRMIERRHYFSDCLAGIVSGSLCGFIISRAVDASIIPVRYIMYMCGLI